jgi:two-component system OmpR family response regulator/two-component system response regulator TctD
MISKPLGPKVLLVEKNNHLFNILNSCSIYHRIQVDRVQHLTDIPATISHTYTLLIIDINLIKEDNALVIKQIRRHNPLLPIIAIGPDNPKHEIISCNLEINIYHHKPIHCELLKAQITQLASIFHKRIILEIGNIKVDLFNRSFFVNNKKIIFNYQEFHLILLLLKSAGDTLDRDKICNCFAGSHKDISYAAIDTLVSRIRTKLKTYLKEPFIKTEYKLGYRINPLYLKDYRIEKV